MRNTIRNGFRNIHTTRYEELDNILRERFGQRMVDHLNANPLGGFSEELATEAWEWLVTMNDINEDCIRRSMARIHRQLTTAYWDAVEARGGAERPPFPYLQEVA